MAEHEENLSTPGDRQLTSRRGFLAGAAGLTGVALSVGAWKPVFAQGPADALLTATGIGQNSTTVGAIGLQLDETTAGPLSFAVGGNAFADVVSETSGNGTFQRKHIGAVKYEEVTLQCGTSMSKAFYDWLASIVSGEALSHSGAILGANANFKVFLKTDFVNAVVTEVGMPALDAASKDAAKMTIKFAPESTRVTLNSGESLARFNQKISPKWLVSNFKLTITGMNASFVNKIDAITIKANFTDFTEGDGGPTRKVLSSVDIPNLKLTIPEAHALEFMKWHQDFVINGNSSPENEKSGHLAYLASGSSTELFGLDLERMGIFALDPDPLALATTGVEHLTAQLYCDSMRFSFRS